MSDKETGPVPFYLTLAVGLTCAALLFMDSLLHAMALVSDTPVPWMHHALTAPVTIAIGIAFVHAAKGLYNER